MSISLNNHESRITVLESKSSSGIVESNLSNPGFVKFDNGMIMNFGIKTSSADANTINYVKPFSKITLSVIGTEISHNDGNYSFDHYGLVLCKTTTLSSCKFLMDKAKHKGFYWIAIGILYTYRYIIKNTQKFAPLSYLFNKEV